MSEIDAITALEAVRADQKKANAFLKKVFSFAPKDSTTIDADQLVKKLDKIGLASLVIEAVVRLTESIDVTGRTTVQIDLCKDEMIKSQKKIEKLQDKLITSQEESLEKLTKSAETLAGVSETVKVDVQELVEQKMSYADLVAKKGDSAVGSSTAEKQKAPTKSALKQAVKEANQDDERQRSVIISGLPRGFGSESTEMKDNLDDILGYMDMVPLKSQVLSCGYVGKVYKSKAGKECQLIRVTFSSISNARQCVRESNQLKGTDDWGDVYINPDRTTSERQEIKKLVAEMKTNNASDPSKFWKIVNMKLVSFEKAIK